jgi:hypothetical protein
MSLNQRLSDLFLDDLRHSEYYRTLPAADRANLDTRLQDEERSGRLPLVPGATDEQLAALEQAAYSRLGVNIPCSLQAVLRQVDGFVEAGVTLYCVDADLGEEGFDYGPGIVAENGKLWEYQPQARGRYLFIGETDLWLLALDIESGSYAALARGFLDPGYRFEDAEGVVNDLLEQALGHRTEGHDLQLRSVGQPLKDTDVEPQHPGISI